MLLLLRFCTYCHWLILFAHCHFHSASDRHKNAASLMHMYASAVTAVDIYVPIVDIYKKNRRKKLVPLLVTKHMR